MVGGFAANHHIPLLFKMCSRHSERREESLYENVIENVIVNSWTLLLIPKKQLHRYARKVEIFPQFIFEVPLVRFAYVLGQIAKKDKRWR